ncbi:glucan 1,3 beta-glucosidase [Coprinopsis sp. MPI-PUGE-AT-0042]|nr:glucan 1,3 beta-glucosidase [Coprinopsis sp. MPI-PUGE-AT-0042]
MRTALEQTKARNNKARWLVIGSIVGLVVLIAIGVTVGVVVSKNNKSSSSSSSSSSSGDTKPGNSTNPGSSVDLSDPSNFAKDDRLHKAFYGMAYTPHNALLDFGCANTLEQTIQDIQLLSQLTSRIRIYGSDCNQTAQVLEAIKQTKVEMEVFLGIYTVPDDLDAYTRQRDAVMDALKEYGAEHVAGVTVGNEFMLNWVTEHGSQDPNSAIGKEGSAILVADIEDTRTHIAALNLDKKIPVGNSDAGSYFADDVLAVIDYGLSNVHAWFANTTEAEAADWVFTFFEENNIAKAATVPNNPKMYIAETGWPTGSKDVSNESNGFGRADIQGLQTFLDTFVCQANQNNVGYFFFEMFDEEWKDVKYGGVEGHWGIFNGDRTLKDGLVLPDCTAPALGSR